MVLAEVRLGTVPRSDVFGGVAVGEPHDDGEQPVSTTRQEVGGGPGLRWRRGSRCYELEPAIPVKPYLQPEMFEFECLKLKAQRCQVFRRGIQTLQADSEDDVMYHTLDDFDALLLETLADTPTSLNGLQAMLAEFMSSENGWQDALRQKWMDWLEQGILVAASAEVV